MEFQVKITPEEQDMSARVRSLRMATAIFNERDKHMAQV